MNKKTLFRAAALCAMAALIPACGGGGSGVGGGGSLGNFVDYRISGPGNKQIMTIGGVAADGVGGPGGSVFISSTTGSDVRLLKTGAIDASFDVPAGTPDLGDNPLVVSTAVTVTYTGANGVNTVAQNGMFFGQNGLSAATGLWIQNGGMLTLPPDNNAGPGSSSGIRLTFPRGIRIDSGGTLNVAVRGDLPTAGSALRLDCVGFVSAGTISTESTDPAGGDAGNLSIFSTAGALIHKGTILTTGRGTTGAGGGHVDLGFGDVGGLFNTGTIDSSGAPYPSGAGGASGSITLLNWTPVATGTGPLCNGGDLTARGGAGGGAGGAGGVISIDATLGWGPVSNSAILDARGGNVGITGNGGKGGNIKLQSVANLCRCAGLLLTSGGNGGPTGGTGGDGGDITITQTGIDLFGPVAGKGNNLGVWVGASLSAGGGIGIGPGPSSHGGNGGKVKIQNSAGGIVAPGHSPIVVVGLININTYGGNGFGAGFSGGPGGDITIETNAAADPNGVNWLGTVLNEIPLQTRGGNSPAGSGGSGGTVSLRSVGAGPNTFPVTEYSTVNLGQIDASGGSGLLAAGNGGSISITDRSVVANSGDLLASAGNVPPGSADGGDAGAIKISTDTSVFDGVGSAENSGILTAIGGTGTQAGKGGAVTLYNHFRTSNRGKVYTMGGSGSALGGNGGTITISSDVDVRNSADLNSSGGSVTTGTGGNAAAVTILGESAAHAGDISCAGGGSTLGIGGDGNLIRIEGTIDLATAHGTLGVQGGPGAVAAGLTGSVLLNGVPLPLTNGLVIK